MKNLFDITSKRFLAASALALAVPLSAMAFQGGKGGCDARDGMRGASMKQGAMMHGGGMMAMRGLHRLNLSEAQDDKIFEIMHAQAPKMREQMKSLRKSEDELRALKAAPDFSEAKAKQLVDRIAGQRADMEMARLQTERQIMGLLTPEQQKQLADMKQRGPGKRDDRGPRS
ncbi:Spy/CpxP family protein refolding chaperone [Azonexus caeni]|jgi:Spy/CpxP family protein refolding chaperone|uniref:Spy/CpxP family protein refolding chaperone n=1 Tax=Azonexus caeni TaxID=266126 RepID=UPI002BEA20F2|nr:Spy/CpxP family protein refolding chaperone [Azonexus sp.]